MTTRCHSESHSVLPQDIAKEASLVGRSHVERGKRRTFACAVVGPPVKFTQSLTGGRKPMAPLLPSLTRGYRAALLLVVVACLSPGRVSAECGDYVTILNVPSGETHQQASHESGATDSHQSPARPPCHGPNCSGSPTREFPPIPPAPVTSNPVKEAVRHAGASDAADASPSAFDRDTTSLRPIRRAASVFHPPRLG